MERNVLVNAINISEGRSQELLRILASVPDVLDVHRDEHHHRAVVTVAGEAAVRALARAAVAGIDLRRHSGVHPRLGALDVVPFVPWGDSSFDDARRAAADFVRWAADELAL